MTHRNYDCPPATDATIYAYTANGREILEGIAPDGKTRYWVQPQTDNYWLCVRTPFLALRAYTHPEEFHRAA